MPKRFTEAEYNAARKAKNVVPSTLKSSQWKTVDPAIRERAFFSARCTLATFLQRAANRLEDLAAGVSPGSGYYTNPATIRMELKQTLDSLNYRPESGKEGTIEDLRSDGRLNLIIETNARMAAGYGQYLQGQDPDVIDEWPCQELIRIMQRKEPRDWPIRWAQAGGKIYGDRMIARKDDPIWTRISAFGLPYPPFDFNSGMGVIDIDRDEAEALGVVSPSDKISPKAIPMNKGLQQDLFDGKGGVVNALLNDLGDKAEMVRGVVYWNEE